MVENGCMRVIAGSHKFRNRRYEAVDREKHLFGSEIISEDIDSSKIVDLDLKVGECHFHDAFTIHGSNPNTSQKRRCGYTMRYMPATVHCNDPSLKPSHRIYLLRGEDRTDGFNIYAPVPDF
jgi:ectoine hydroxylase-related dioxygenase (phytanoyl-CoA dioxygenase family)